MGFLPRYQHLQSSKTGTITRTDRYARHHQHAQPVLGGPGMSVAAALRHREGAGTMSPHTVLRAITLSPGPWPIPNPAVAPPMAVMATIPTGPSTISSTTDQASPDAIQETYLASLEALGIKAADHDIRFVEDNWESPTLGAWGVGWEVWLDGMEVTQFTYFSNAAESIASLFRLRSHTASRGWRCISKTWKAFGTSAGTASAVTARSGAFEKAVPSTLRLPIPSGSSSCSPSMKRKRQI